MLPNTVSIWKMSDRYDIDILPRAEKDLDRLRQGRERAVSEILKLEMNPLAGHVLKGSLQGTRSLEFNLKGGGAYRAVYFVLDSERLCVVFIVGSHENIYKEAERRYKAIQKR